MKNITLLLLFAAAVLFLTGCSRHGMGRHYYGTPSHYSYSGPGEMQEGMITHRPYVR